MNKYLKITAVICVFLITSSYIIARTSQNKENYNFIVGKISNKNGDPVSGIVVKIKGKNKTAISDNNGEFALYATNEDTLSIRIKDLEKVFSLRSSPPIITSKDYLIELSYKNIINVNDEENSEVPINFFP